MNNQLMIFQGEELEILTKEDVNLKFDGAVLFNAKQIGDMLGYARPMKAITCKTRENQRVLIKNSNVLKQDLRKLNKTGETFITEKGAMKLIITSNLLVAERFEDKVWEIVTQVQRNGRPDTSKNKLHNIDDEKERKLLLGIHQLEQALNINPKDFLTILAYNNMKQELLIYKQDKKLLEIENSLQNAFKYFREIK